ncbi:cyclic nucleotide-binding domain protein (macronuclear) [Tetrahymena thermophila SB210]|uniref:Cyclic nucleotide-binding domain protein n=1 Tax=Tetrahymena thermophila (strain SB210) TaxID=312017 RepID=W7XFG0_TETTS|nr:cyclic nucleotide-binding domain protein [Tetrahymena thermophila SB210]EWS72751.1 cyclic nucleotide-binding domain protein [Tetrahymena thermophila SB210]|eukprot:XP_012654729.1 cyclic nucleotide-binding domain protein [Tetrahymena thermophila SB210]
MTTYARISRNSHNIQNDDCKFNMSDKVESKFDCNSFLSDEQYNTQQKYFGFKTYSEQQNQKLGDYDSSLANQSIYELSLEEYFNNPEKRSLRSNLSIAPTQKCIVPNNIWKYSFYFQLIAEVISRKSQQSFQKRFPLKKSDINTSTNKNDSDQYEGFDNKLISKTNMNNNQTLESRMLISKSRKSTYFKLDEFNKINESAKISTFKYDNSSRLNQNTVWKRKWMSIIFIISKVRKFAVQCSVIFKPQLLNKFQVSLINDIAIYLNYRQYRKIVKCIINNFYWIFSIIPIVSQLYINFLSAILKHFPLFHYYSKLYILWEIILFICSGILFFYIPLEYSFQITRNQFFIFFFSYLCPFLFGFNIFVRANTKTTQSKSFIENHIEIFHKYLKSDLIVDIISLICLNKQIFQLQASYFFFFIRITKSFRVMTLLREKFLLNLKISGFISLLFLLFQVLYYTHLMSCAWFTIGNYGLQFQEGWIYRYGLIEKSIFVKYLYSFYYSVITMSTIGFGDLVPQTDIEMLMTIFIVLISSFVFQYSINQIGSILSVFKTKNDVYLQEVAKINKYFKQYTVDLEIQARSRQYLDYIFSDNKEHTIQTIEQLSTLSVNLQGEIKMNVFTKRLKNISLFDEIFSNETLQQIAVLMKEIIYSPDQSIIDINSKENMLYIIHSGAVVKQTHSQTNANAKEIQKLCEGAFFNLDRFLTNSQSCQYQYKSVGISSILQLQLDVFLDTIRKNEIEYEKFMQIKDQVIYNQNFGAAKMSCLSCQQKNHQLMECPFIFYTCRKTRIINKHLNDFNKSKKNFIRNPRQFKFQTLINQVNVKENIEKFLLYSSYSGVSQLLNPSIENQKMYIDDDAINLSQLEHHDKVNKEAVSQQDNIEYDKNKAVRFKSCQSLSQLHQNQQQPSFGEELTLQTSEQATGMIQSELNGLNSNMSAKSIYEKSQKNLTALEVISKLEQEHLQAENKSVIKQNEINKDGINNKIQKEHNKKQIDMILQFLQQQKNQMDIQSKNSKLFHQIQNYGSYINYFDSDRSIKDKVKKKQNFVFDRQISNNFKRTSKAHQNSQENKLFYYEFDQIKQFQYYFPNYNYEQVIAKANIKFFQQMNIKLQNFKKNRKQSKCIHNLKN